MRRYLKHIDGDSLFVEFFKKFSRLEYALKRVGFLDNSRNKEVKVDWNGFAHTVSLEFERALEADGDLRASVELIESAPRRRLVLSANSHGSPVCWKDAKASQGGRLEDLLVYVRSIRNNLFHGEKAGTIVAGSGGDGRDSELIRGAIVILDVLATLAAKFADLPWQVLHLNVE